MLFLYSPDALHRKGLGAQLRCCGTQVSQSHHGASMVSWYQEWTWPWGMKAACFLENVGLFLPLVSSGAGKYHLVIIQSVGSGEGLSLGQAQESVPGARGWGLGCLASPGGM